MPDIIIIGAGHAGVNAAIQLRKRDPHLDITLISNEPHYPYHRPPLSKQAVFAADLPMQLLQSKEYFARKNINLLLNTQVSAIDPSTRKVLLQKNQPLAYQQLIIATGTLPKQLAIAGVEHVHNIYRYSDIEVLGPLVQSTQKRIVVIGGGFIGCEFAAGAMKLGKTVSLLTSGSHVMRRSVAPELGQRVTQWHRSQGMDLRTYSTPLAIHDNYVRTNQGNIDYGLVVAGVGAQANTKLAKAANLVTHQGIVVNEFGRTSDANIYAIGDVAEFPYSIHRIEGHFAPSHRCIESVQNANEQSAHIANNIISLRNGEPCKKYSLVPWFWSDQGDLKLQIAGLSNLNATHKTLPTSSATSLTIVHLENNAMIAADTMNALGNHLAVRKLLALGIPITWDMISAANYDLKTLFKSLL